MKKRTIITAIILWTIVALAVITAISYAANGGFNRMANQDTLIKNEEVTLGQIKSIILDGTSQIVEVRKTNGDQLKISQYGNPKTREENLFLIESSEDSVRIYFNKHKGFRLYDFDFYSFIQELVIEIPEKYKGNIDFNTSSGSLRTEDEFTLKNVLLHSSSGSIRIDNNLTADNIHIKTSSGSIHTQGEINLTENMKAESSSGAISLYKVHAKGLQGETSSGGIRLDDIDVESYDLQSSSGAIKINAISGSGEMKTASGGIQAFLKNPKDDIRLTSSSGSVRVEVEPSLQFTFEAKTNSASIHTDFAVEKNERGNKAIATVGKNPTVHIKIDTTSGSIRVEQ